MTAGPFMATVVDTSGLVLYLVGDSTQEAALVHARAHALHHW